MKCLGVRLAHKMLLTPIPHTPYQGMLLTPIPETCKSKSLECLSGPFGDRNIRDICTTKIVPLSDKSQDLRMVHYTHLPLYKTAKLLTSQHDLCVIRCPRQGI